MRACERSSRAAAAAWARGSRGRSRATAGRSLSARVAASRSRRSRSEIGGEWVQVDVADRGSVERAVAEAGEVDLLVANAGVGDNHERRPSWEIDPADWWRVYEVNVLASTSAAGR